MNILPLIFALLIIFSCLCTTFLKEVKSLHLIEITLEGYNQAEKEIRNAIIKRSYEKIKGDPSSESAKKEGTKRLKTFHSKRSHFPPLETSKFYLKALAKTEIELSQHPLYEPLAQLLRLLYQKNVFNHYPNIKGPEYKLIEALVKKAQKFPSAKDLSYLHPDDSELQKIYYKMLKGTNLYTEEVGIPPLAHFISLEKTDKVIHLKWASPPILKALFTEPLAQHILQREAEHWKTSQKHYSLSKEDLATLFMQEPGQSAIFTALQPYLSDSLQSAKKKSLAKRDKKTDICIEKEL